MLSLQCSNDDVFEECVYKWGAGTGRWVQVSAAASLRECIFGELP